MAEIWTRATRQRQPQGSASIFGAVNWASPLSSGLVRLVCFDGLQARDLVTGYSLPVFGSGFGNTTTRLGRGSTTTNETSYWTLPFNGESLNSFSFGWVGQFTGGGSAQLAVRDNTFVGGTFLFRNNGGNWQHRYADATATPAGVASNLVPYAAIFVADGVNGSTYVDGRLTVQQAKGADSLYSPWYIHQNSTNAQGFLGTSVLLAIWKRPLSTAEVTEWSRNPWQLFAPERRVSYFFPASGIPTLSAATAVSITSTTATPRVTVTF